MEIQIVVNPAFNHISELEEAVKTVNLLQTSFNFSVALMDWVNDGEPNKPWVDRHELLGRMKKNLGGKPAIGVLQSPLEQGYLSDYKMNAYIFSIFDWESKLQLAPLKIPLKAYLAQMLVNGLPCLAAAMPAKVCNSMSHEPPIGCYADYCDDKTDIKLSMICAYICAGCEETMLNSGVTKKQIESLEQILLFVRRALIRKGEQTPLSVFIGHGRSDIWKQLANYLRKLGLKVDEFNQESAAGVHTTERLQEMLNRACFAFLVMTAEDNHADRKKHARENVVHEIGLFQGKLGTRRAIILKDEECQGFSNIHGLTYITFSGKLGPREYDQIRAVLERENLLRPSKPKTFRSKYS